MIDFSTKNPENKLRIRKFLQEFPMNSPANFFSEKPPKNSYGKVLKRLLEKFLQGSLLKYYKEFLQKFHKKSFEKFNMDCFGNSFIIFFRRWSRYYFINSSRTFWEIAPEMPPRIDPRVPQGNDLRFFTEIPHSIPSWIPLDLFTDSLKHSFKKISN